MKLSEWVRWTDKPIQFACCADSLGKPNLPIITHVGDKTTFLMLLRGHLKMPLYVCTGMLEITCYRTNTPRSMCWLRALSCIRNVLVKREHFPSCAHAHAVLILTFLAPLCHLAAELFKSQLVRRRRRRRRRHRRR